MAHGQQLIQRQTAATIIPVHHLQLDNNSSATALTVTVVAPGSSSVTLFIAEIGNIGGFDTHAASLNSATGTGTDAQTTGNATPSVQPGLIWAAGFRAIGTGNLSTGTGFTSGLNTGPNINESENIRYTSTSAAAATMTDTVGTDDVIMFGLWYKTVQPEFP